MARGVASGVVIASSSSPESQAGMPPEAIASPTRVALAGRFGLPVHYIGVGEGEDDLQPFVAADFARALVGLDRADAERTS